MALCLSVAFGHERGWYLGDNRFVSFWAPDRSIGAITSVWNSRIDLGGPVQHHLPLTDGTLAALRAAGLEPWVAQRVWFALLLTMGAVGTALVVRAVLPGARWEAGIAGAWFVCAPLTSGFFFPTGLFLHVALAPWFVLAAWYGLTTPSRWRWAAVFALAAGASSSMNPPGLVLAMLPALIVAMALVVGGRARIADLWAWSARTGLLTAAVLAPVVVRASLTAETLARNLGSTETVEAVSLSSSWPESLRGLGFWLQYWNPRGPLVWPYLTTYFANRLVVVATFAPPALALAVLVFGRRRARLAFGALLVVTVALMVGAFPVGDPPPFGGLLRWSYDAIPPLFAFRNVYKAGAGVVLSVAVLLALGVREVRERQAAGGAGGRWVLGVGAIVVTLVFAASGWPLLSGDAYRYGQRLEGDPPTYWSDAVAWLDDQPGAGRVLVLPGAASEDYRWGSAAGGDIFPSALDRPAIFAQPLTGSPAEAANLTAALDRAVTGGRYEPGTLAPIARRLGVQLIVLRNDLRWQETGVSRPGLLRELREDRTLSPVAQFGRAGQNVTRSDDASPEARYEQTLPPIEVFAVPGVDDVVRAVSASPGVLLSGDGAAWPSLARANVLDELGPVRAIGSMRAQDVAAALQSGASAVITDSNRRRPLGWGQEGRTLTALDDERVDDLYGAPGSQSVATYGDARRISLAGPSTLFDTGPSNRPAAAFDGDLTTAWLTGINSAPQGQRIRIELAQPVLVDEVRVRVAEPDGGRQVTRLGVLLDDRPPLSFDVTPGVENVLRMSPTAARSISLAPLGVIGSGAGPFGLSEVSVRGLDLRERVTMPDQLATFAQQDAAIEGALESAPLSIELQRLIGRPSDTESALARRFRLPTERPFDVVGGLQLGPETSRLGLARVIGTRTWAEGWTSEGRTAATDEVLATDGDRASSWSVPGEDLATLIVHRIGSDIRSVQVSFDTGPGVRPPERLYVRRAGEDLDISAAQRCAQSTGTFDDGVRIVASTSSLGCTIEIEWPSDAAPAAEVKLSMAPQSILVGGLSMPMGVREVEVNRVPNLISYVPGACRADLASLDNQPLPVRLQGSLASLLSGAPVAMEACSSIDLGGGWHELLVSPGTPIDWLRFSAGDGDAPVPATRVPVSVLHRGTDDQLIAVDAPAGTQIILGQAFAPGWTAEVDGGALVTQSLDSQAGWVLEQDGLQELRVSHAKSTVVQRSVLLSLSTLWALPLVILLDPRRRHRGLALAGPPRRRVADGASRAPALAALVFALLVGGWPSLAVAAGSLLAVRRRWVTARALGGAAVGLVIVAVAAAVPPLGPSLDPVWPLWPYQRGLAHELVRVAVLLMVVGMTTSLGARPTTVDGDPDASPPATLDGRPSGGAARPGGSDARAAPPS